MAKLVILKIGQGNFDRGFPITLQVGEEGARPFIEVTGQLPPNSEIVEHYKQWRSIYSLLGEDLRLERPNAQITNSSDLIDNCRNAAETLSSSLESWLNSDEFRPLKERMLEKLSQSEPIRAIVQTADLDLRRLPWHLWTVFDRYSLAEVALSSPNYEKIAKTNLFHHRNIKILAILGNSKGIDIKKDREYLEDLPRAEITFLVEPKRQDINDRLWEQEWDILFFAGHSRTYGDKGIISINLQESLSIRDLKEGLKKTIGKGLQLAIFNSCDGLGLARDLEDLHLPQIIVMREPIPDNVAQKFLKYFLTNFSRGQSLYLAVRQARERLRSDGLDTQTPGATWLPIICQNLAATPLIWPVDRKKLKPNYFRLAAACAAVSIAVVGGIVAVKNFSWLSGRSGQPAKVASKKSYQNPSYGFKVEYPSNWEFQKIEDPTTKEIVSFSSLNELNSNISPQVRVIVMVEVLNKNMSLEEYRKSSESQIKNFLPGGKVIESSGTILAKQQAYRLVYSGKNQQNDLVQKIEVVTLYKRKAYAITYEAKIGKYPEHLNTFSKMIESFEITDSDK